MMRYTLRTLSLLTLFPAIAADGSAGPDGTPRDVVEGIKAYKSQSYSEASISLARALKADPKNQQALFYLGGSLDGLGLEGAAAAEYDAIVRQGTAGSHFKYALPKLVDARADSGDWRGVAWLAAHVPRSDWPRSAVDELSYGLALREFDDGDWSGSVSALSQVSEKSDLIAMAQLLEGRARAANGDHRGALRAWTPLGLQAEPDGQAALKRQVAEETGYVAAGSAVWTARDATARETGRLEKATLMAMVGQPDLTWPTPDAVPRSSPVWRRAQVLAARIALLEAKDPKAAREHAAAAQAPARKGVPPLDYLPEAPMVEAAACLASCDQKRATKALDGAAGERAVVASWLSSAGSSQAAASPEEVRAGLGDDGVPEQVLARLDRDPDYSAVAARVAAIEEDRAAAAAMSRAWRTALGARVEASLDAARTDAERELQGRALAVFESLGVELARADAETTRLREGLGAPCTR